MKASDCRAISAFLSCMSETIFTSPTLAPDISRGTSAFGITPRTRQLPSRTVCAIRPINPTLPPP
uniref:Lysine decarboxylase-like protein n=1 Tax=Arundo donax TaxID=35708 RepID=A0A0A9FHQ1_ARUDO